MPLGSYAHCSGIPTLLRCLSGIHILSLAQREKLVVSRRKWQDSCTSPPRHLTPPGRSRNEDMCPNLPYVAFSHSHSPKSHNVTSLSLGASNPSLDPLLSASRHVYVSCPEQEQSWTFNDPSSQHRQVDPSSKICVRIKEPSPTASATTSQDSSSRKVSHK